VLGPGTLTCVGANATGVCVLPEPMADYDGTALANGAKAQPFEMVSSGALCKPCAQYRRATASVTCKALTRARAV
jgi:hypothetical protein